MVNPDEDLIETVNHVVEKERTITVNAGYKMTVRTSKEHGKKYYSVIISEAGDSGCSKSFDILAEAVPELIRILEKDLRNFEEW